MKKFLEILKKCPLFDKIAEEDLLRMLECLGARTESFDKKYTIFAEGTPAKYIGIVLSGTAQIIQIDYNGNRSILSVVRAGDVFAEAFACSETAYLPVSVIADDPCEIMMIDCAHILHTCSNNCGFHQQLIYNLMKDLATKSRVFHRKIEIISKRTTREKLLTYLSFLSKESGSREVTVPFDRQELADYLEVDRSGLSAEISKMKNEGIIENKKNQFLLL